MATFSKGILDGFNGRVGNVVGSTWKGKSVMKIRPATVTNPNTERQQNQRARFGLVGRFTQAHRNLIRMGFRAYTKDMTASNAAMSYNLANAVAGQFPDLSIDFSKVRISMGSLAPVSGVTVASESVASVSLTWLDNSQANNASETDQLIVSLYDAVTNEVVYVPGCASRSQAVATLNLPAEWSGRTPEVFVFLISLEGNGLSANRETVSNTVYAGQVQIM
jgi:hypothetical protein